MKGWICLTNPCLCIRTSSPEVHDSHNRQTCDAWVVSSCLSYFLVTFSFRPEQVVACVPVVVCTEMEPGSFHGVQMYAAYRSVHGK